MTYIALIFNFKNNMKKIITKLLMKLLTLKFYYYKIFCLFGNHKRLYFSYTRRIPLYGNKSALHRHYKIVDFYKCKVCGKGVADERN